MVDIRGWSQVPNCLAGSVQNDAVAKVSDEIDLLVAGQDQLV